MSLESLTSIISFTWPDTFFQASLLTSKSFLMFLIRTPTIKHVQRNHVFFSKTPSLFLALLPIVLKLLSLHPVLTDACEVFIGLDEVIASLLHHCPRFSCLAFLLYPDQHLQCFSLQCEVPLPQPGTSGFLQCLPTCPPRHDSLMGILYSPQVTLACSLTWNSLPVPVLNALFQPSPLPGTSLSYLPGQHLFFECVQSHNLI